MMDPRRLSGVAGGAYLFGKYITTGSKVFVVMTTGERFLGTLEEFDNQFLVLRDVLQSAPGEKLWVNPAPPQLETDAGPKDLALENVVLVAMSQITRIWPNLSAE